MNQGVTTYRYLLFTIFILNSVFAFYLSILKNKKILYVIVGTMLVSIAISLPHIARASVKNQANQDNYQLINILEKTGYTKGYAGYFDAGINSYLSNGTIQVLPTICSSTAIAQFPFLINDTPYHTQADRSFYIYNSIPSELGDTCDPAMLFKQAGIPVNIIHDKNFTIYFYNYDIIKIL